MIRLCVFLGKELLVGVEGKAKQTKLSTWPFFGLGLKGATHEKPPFLSILPTLTRGDPRDLGLYRFWVGSNAKFHACLFNEQP